MCGPGTAKTQGPGHDCRKFRDHEGGGSEPKRKTAFTFILILSRACSLSFSSLIRTNKFQNNSRVSLQVNMCYVCLSTKVRRHIAWPPRRPLLHVNAGLFKVIALGHCVFLWRYYCSNLLKTLLETNNGNNNNNNVVGTILSVYCVLSTW